MIEKNASDPINEYGPGVESTRVVLLQEPRMKRQAISAEPLSSLAEMEGDLMKIPKSTM